MVGTQFGSAWHENTCQQWTCRSTQCLGHQKEETTCHLAYWPNNAQFLHFWKIEVAGNNKHERLGCDGAAQMHCSGAITHNKLACQHET